jgi:hypothetical protein
MLNGITEFLRGMLSRPRSIPTRVGATQAWRPPLQPFGFNDFLDLDVPPREMLLNPILPERSLAVNRRGVRTPIGTLRY